MPENNQIMSVAGQLVGMPLAGPESFSAQQLDYLKRALGVDETVLWEGDGTSGTTINLSESAKNFDRIRIYAHDSNRGRGLIYEHNPSTVENNDTLSFCIMMSDCILSADWTGWYYTQLTYSSTAATSLTNDGGNQVYIKYSTKTLLKNDGRYLVVDKIVGIHRISGGN